MDTWILLYNKEANGEHNRQIYLLKSRGMKHSNQVREFLLTEKGIQLRDVYVGPEGVVTGSARLAQEAKVRAAKLQRQMDLERRRRELDRKRARARAEIQALEAEVEAEELEIDQLVANANRQDERTAADEQAMAESRKQS
jgi:circadian clock protein KaiC